MHLFVLINFQPPHIKVFISAVQPTECNISGTFQIVNKSWISTPLWQAIWVFIWIHRFYPSFRPSVCYLQPGPALANMAPKTWFLVACATSRPNNKKNPQKINVFFYFHSLLGCLAFWPWQPAAASGESKEWSFPHASLHTSWLPSIAERNDRSQCWQKTYGKNRKKKECELKTEFTELVIWTKGKQ